MIRLVSFLLSLPLAFATLNKFTFQLAPSEVQCFFDEVEKDTEYTLLFQVIAGGHYDVDCFIQDPKGQLIYRKLKIHHDNLSGKAEMSGVHKFCFGNQFSSFTQKKIYFHLEIGKVSPVVPNDPGKGSALTQLESSCTNIHYSLRKVIYLQSQQRIQALIDWLHVDGVNTHIMYWAASETIILFLVTVGQVMVLKKFFTEKASSAYMATTST